MPKKEQQERMEYYNVIDGKFRAKVDKDDPKAIKRDWKNPQTGVEGTSYERVYTHFEGKIVAIRYNAHEKYGSKWIITMEDNEGKFAFQIGTKTRYSTDFCCKLPNIDFNEFVELQPYDFEDDKQKRRAGIKITQGGLDGVAVKGAYMEEYAEGKWRACNGMPVMKEKNPDSDDWTKHFIDVAKFLKNEVKEKILPLIEEANKAGSFEDLKGSPLNDGSEVLDELHEERDSRDISEEPEPPEDDLPF